MKIQFQKELSEFAALLAIQISGDTEATKSQISAELENKLPAIEDKLPKNVEAKVANIVEDVLRRGSFTFLPSVPFDSIVGSNITIVTEGPGSSEALTPNTPEPPAKKKCF